MKFPAICLALMAAACVTAHAQPFQFPTANHALYEAGGEEKFFVGTTGKGWESGTFGPVRSDGWQMHEGIDIRCMQRDRKGEPTDPVLAAADGTVTYVSTKAALSNYGKYIVIRHAVDGIDVYSLYAHLSEIAPGITVGKAVKAGQQIAIMGRTSNTHEHITKDRAHVHFELNLFYNDRFSAWFRKTSHERNDHGDWNGQNLAGLDARIILLDERNAGFNLATWIQNRPALFKVFIRKADLSFARRYPGLVVDNPVARQQGIVGYEVSLDGNGVPVRLVPRAASEITGNAKYKLIEVNEPEYRRNHARRLVVQKGARWYLGSKGIHLLDLIAY